MVAIAASEPLRAALIQGWRGFTANLGPMAAILVLGLVIITSYYGWPAARGWLDTVAIVRVSWGFSYSVVAMGLAAGLVPLLVRWGLGRAVIDGRELAVVLFWALRGIDIDLFYRAQSLLFGADPTLGTVLAKLAFDMGVYTPLYALPVSVVVYAWKDGEPVLDLVRSPAFWRERYLSALISNWGLWIPGVAIIYSLPAGLQLPVQNLFICLWALILTVVSKRS